MPCFLSEGKRTAIFLCPAATPNSKPKTKKKLGKLWWNQPHPMSLWKSVVFQGEFHKLSFGIEVVWHCYGIQAKESKSTLVIELDNGVWIIKFPRFRRSLGVVICKFQRHDSHILKDPCWWNTSDPWFLAGQHLKEAFCWQRIWASCKACFDFILWW